MRLSVGTLHTLTAGYTHFSNIEIGAPYPARREGGITSSERNCEIPGRLDAPRRLLANDPNIYHISCSFWSLVRTSSIVTSSTSLLFVFSSRWLHLRLCRVPTSPSVSSEARYTSLLRPTFMLLLAPHPSLLEALDRRYLGFEGVCSFGSCTL